MKRFSIFLLIAVFFAGSVFAQNAVQPAQERGNRQRENSTVTVEGTLKLERGFVAVESGDSVLAVPMLNRYIGFINGLKEGARVSIEGFRHRNNIQPVKVTIDGKSYDFPAQNRGAAFGRPNQNHRRDNVRPGHNNFSPNRRDASGKDGCSCNNGRRR